MVVEKKSTLKRNVFSCGWLLQLLLRAVRLPADAESEFFSAPLQQQSSHSSGAKFCYAQLQTDRTKPPRCSESLFQACCLSDDSDTKIQAGGPNSQEGSSALRSDASSPCSASAGTDGCGCRRHETPSCPQRAAEATETCNTLTQKLQISELFTEFCIMTHN